MELAVKAPFLPMATLPAEADAVLPVGPERLLIASQLVLVGHAAAGSAGYRVGTQHDRSMLLRWFPTARMRQVPMFLLEPFEWRHCLPVRAATSPQRHSGSQV